MATSIFDGPLHVPGSMQAFLAAYFGSPVADPNPDAGPSLFYQGDGIFDPRLVYLKDKVQGNTGVVQGFASLAWFKSVSAVPAALATNNIAAAQNVVSGTAMTLAAASVGISVNIPIRPFSNSLNSIAPVTAAIAIDFGFGFVATTAGNATVTVNSTAQFLQGQPLVIAGVGNAGGTIPLLTQVATIVDSTHITVIASAVPLATNTATPLGTGELWGPSSNGFPLPQAAYPFFAGGPALFLDPRQAITRAVSITGAASSVGGTFTVRGWDIYHVPMTETVTVGAATIGYGVKAFKYIASVTPNFTDAHNYSVGVCDVFGFATRPITWEDTDVKWDAAMMTATTGWTAGAPSITAQTATSADPRGTIQISTNGGGTGITGSASNGTVSGLAMAGRRIDMSTRFTPVIQTLATPSAPYHMFGATQFSA